MRFQDFRTRITSFSKSSKSTTDHKPSIKSASTHNDTFDSSIPEIMITAPKASSFSKREAKKLAQATVTTSESRDYEEFLDKARKDAEKAERKRLKEIREARERNMSPWAGRM